MSPTNMRVLLINAFILLVAFLVIPTQSREGSIRPGATAVTAKFGKFLEHSEPGKEANSKILLDLMKSHFDFSMDYLLTSKQYGSQYVQRPGMAKYLDEASSHQWEEGMDILKKFLQRGGSIDDVDFKPAFKVQGNPELNLAETDGFNNNYLATLKGMLDDSKSRMKTMNHLHHLGGKVYENGGDAEIAHYFDSKLEKDAEVTRELAGHIITLQKMNKMGVAINMFDDDL